MPDRVIFHSDCNSFFLQRGIASSSGTARCTHRGCAVIRRAATASFWPKMNRPNALVSRRRKPFGKLGKNARHLHLLPPHREKYRHYYQVINGIYGRYTDLVEPFSIDESWMDVTGSWKLFEKEPRALADRIRREVRQETGLTISVGVSWNKVFAKLGSDYKKPDATTEFSRDNYRQLVWALPVTSMLYVGRSAADTLKKAGIATIGQLALAEPGLIAPAAGQIWAGTGHIRPGRR